MQLSSQLRIVGLGMRHAVHRWIENVSGPRSKCWVGPVLCYHPATAAANISPMIGSAGGAATDSGCGGLDRAQAGIGFFGELGT